jgi:hypothetical protein
MYIYTQAGLKCHKPMISVRDGGPARTRTRDQGINKYRYGLDHVCVYAYCLIIPYIESRASFEPLCPWSAALVNHFLASSKSFLTPIPFRYMLPRLN